MPIRTVGEYLRRWGFTPQKPVKRAYEQSPAAVQRWLTETYPHHRGPGEAGAAGDPLGGRNRGALDDVGAAATLRGARRRSGASPAAGTREH